MTDPRSFGAWLRRERERRGITLRTIADRTKIGAALLESLERGDISRWPGGIYRRAFVRGYADVVGLDGDLVLANFERVFADPADPAASAPAPGAVVSDAEQPEMRLALVTPAISGITSAAMRRAARDVLCISGIALVGFALRGAVGFWFTAAAAAIALHVSHVLGLDNRALWREWADRRRPSPSGTRAEVVSITDEQARSSSRRARARRVLADLSAAASSARFSKGRRAARS